MEALLLSADSDTSVEDFAWVSDLIDVLGMSFFDKSISKVRIISRLNHLIGQIDAKLRAQVDEVLHHPLFQSLEATWSGCRYLLDELAFSQQIKVRLLDITWSELHRDITRAIDIEHSEIFHKVYNAEFGMAGGEPFGAMLCDYPVALTAKTSGVDDLRVVRGLASVAAASFCPFLFNADPSLLDLDDFAKLHSGIDLNRTYQQESFIKWKSLRSIEDARFIGLTLPYLYIRRQYRPNRFRTDGFVYREGVKGRGDFLKIGSVFAMGVVMARCFSNTGWLAEITGKRYFGGGVVPGLKVHTSPIDGHAQFAAEVMIADSLERSLSEHGFIPVCYSVNSAKGVFYSAASIQSPLAYKASAARANARYSAMLQYVLCTARFAHYMKVIVRDSVGSFSTTEECRNFLQTWIMNYVMSTDEASEILLSQYPLREARVQVNERAGTSGSYMCTVHLKPHFQLESIETSIQFSAEVVSSRVAG
jgi:type VI secretion system protein ImpD